MRHYLNSGHVEGFVQYGRYDLHTDSQSVHWNFTKIADQALYPRTHEERTGYSQNSPFGRPLDRIMWHKRKSTI
jgi:hypothetical protein